MLAAKLVEQPWDAVRLEGQLAEQTEVLAEAAAEVCAAPCCSYIECGCMYVAVVM